MDRMNTPSSRAWLAIRTRSPRMAPPEKGDDGSTARTATERRHRFCRWLAGAAGRRGVRRVGAVALDRRLRAM